MDISNRQVNHFEPSTSKMTFLHSTSDRHSLGYNSDKLSSAINYTCGSQLHVTEYTDHDVQRFAQDTQCYDADKHFSEPQNFNLMTVPNTIVGLTGFGALTTGSYRQSYGPETIAVELKHKTLLTETNGQLPPQKGTEQAEGLRHSLGHNSATLSSTMNYTCGSQLHMTKSTDNNVQRFAPNVECYDNEQHLSEPQDFNLMTVPDTTVGLTGFGALTTGSYMQSYGAETINVELKHESLTSETNGQLSTPQEGTEQAEGVDEVNHTIMSERQSIGHTGKLINYLKSVVVGTKRKSRSRGATLNKGKKRTYKQIEVVHPVRKQVCYVEHPETQMYLNVTAAGVVFAPLNNPTSAKFQRSLFGGYCTSTRERLVFMSFSAFGNCLPSMQYLSVAKTTGVELEKYEDPILDNTDTLDGSSHNRTFIHRYVASGFSVFQSAACPSYYLCNNNGNLDVKTVKFQNIKRDPDIQFRIRYPKKCPNRY